jgi:hypothetical protein
VAVAPTPITTTSHAIPSPLVTMRSTRSWPSKAVTLCPCGRPVLAMDLGVVLADFGAERRASGAGAASTATTSRPSERHEAATSAPMANTDGGDAWPTFEAAQRARRQVAQVALPGRSAGVLSRRCGTVPVASTARRSSVSRDRRGSLRARRRPGVARRPS